MRSHGPLGIEIRNRRKASGRTMQQFAKDCGIGRTALHRYENGHPARPNSTSLARVVQQAAIPTDLAVRLLQGDPALASDLQHALDRLHEHQRLTT
ncbi:helix-turn-helix domain-containing protein [Conexibacter sp. W3-3-2]|uniref:helix-turn-helix domain-containing protein n=1 Tax=Conexibacter sp. W3-3-2 TaxID=2675227 RepID=UPI0012B8B05B|nr:helix-turn-helix transcriptional regulator [Conexibacter sp. W3-3-2]MTD47287.1 helix-turn-helix domain-containing protein [Conexibacter sp. W3-3-2]